jgi:hypothetical protein
VDTLHLVLLGGGVALLGWAVVRWRRSDPTHIDYAARRDMVSLVGLLIAGVVGDSARVSFPSGSVGFNSLSIALVPVAIAAVWLLVRLAAAYRTTASSATGSAAESLRRRHRRG